MTLGAGFALFDVVLFLVIVVWIFRDQKKNAKEDNYYQQLEDLAMCRRAREENTTNKE